MSWPILTVVIEHEADVVLARQRARRIAQLVGFETQDQTRIATAVSEIARNAFSYGGGGRVEFALEGSRFPQRMLIRVRDEGPGIDRLEDILQGRVRSLNGLGAGLTGARRLMDIFTVETEPENGTTVLMGKALPASAPQLQPLGLVDVARRLAQEAADDPLGEIRVQNQELLRSLDELRFRQEEAAQLNAELEATNRGVVALYAELDEKAKELEALNATLEQRVKTAVAAREGAEESLRQSQKMEAVGQLTGGIAHDFNNLLQIVTGNLELLDRHLPPDAGRLRRSAEHAMLGAQRAAALTQRLLAFSRRQPLAPKAIDPNALVTGMSELLRRTLGAHIEIETVLSGGLWTVEADPHQLENALLNLAVNARDAMPEGGKLTIETSNTRLDEPYVLQNAGVAPGQYVALCVTDSGPGIQPEVLERVFEPFFTTKDVGKGTGLGLSMVYGFIKQSGGHVKIYSELGVGTTVKLYLPRRYGTLDASAADVALSIPEGSGEETILVVEDDPEVRAYSVEVLNELGYSVLQAASGPPALGILESNPGIDLLFTDIVLPGGMNGRQLAERAVAAQRSLKVLFTTGYARNAIVHNGRLDPEVDVIGKPFSYSALAAKIREVLDRQA